MPNTPTEPTQSELAILAVLWNQGPATVRQVHEQLNPNKQTGYTTTLKLMQIMADKGLVSRNTSARTHIYRAKVTKPATQKRLARRLLDKAFDGSASQLVMGVLASKKPSKNEIDAIRDMLDAYEKEQK